jgi:ABC-2 type transport system ATP-binding protein
MIKIENINKKIGKRNVLSNISLTFDDGKIYGLRGINGSGKTMLMRAIAGLITLDSGTITVDGKILRDQIDFPPNLGLMIENDNLRPEVTLLKQLNDLSKINMIVDNQQIKQVINSVGLDPDDTRKVREYSLGMKQRGAIAQAVFERPKIILLDEPTNGIDANGVKEMRKLLATYKNKETIIIIASHSSEDLKVLADVVIDISEGMVHE